MAENKEKIKLNEIVAMNTDLLNYLEADEIDEETFNDTKELILTELQNKGGTIVFARRQSEMKIETYRDWETDRKSTRLNSSHSGEARMPSSA